MKKLGMILTAALLALSCLQPAVFADETAVKTALVNVARNKTVTASGTTGGEAAALTDGDFTNENVWSGTSATVDLGRRHELEKIVVFDSGDSASATRQQFKIYGSDSADFAEKTLIHEENDTENSTFPAKGAYVVNLEDKPVFRYVCYEAVSSASVREIEIYANITVTDVSAAKTAYTTSTSQAASGSATGSNTSRVTDGKYSGLFFCNYADHAITNAEGTKISQLNQTVTIDLGASYNIGMIEVYGGNNANVLSASASGNFAIYGSENALTEGLKTEKDADGNFYASYSADNWTTFGDYDYTVLDTSKLHLLANTVGGIITEQADTTGDGVGDKWLPRFALSDGTVYEPYPFNTAAVVSGEENWKPYQATVNEENAYRYITYRKTSPSTIGINEINAYIIHPEVYGVSASLKQATIAFSDFNMDASTLSAVKLYAADDTKRENPVSYTSIELAENGADAVITFDEEKVSAGEKYVISIGAEVANSYGNTLAGAEEFEITLPKAVEVSTQSVTDADGAAVTSITGKTELNMAATVSNGSSKAQNVLVIICAYNENHTLLGVGAKSYTVAANTGNVNVGAGLNLTSALKAGDYVTMHLWDGLDAASSWSDMVKLVAE